MFNPFVPFHFKMVEGFRKMKHRYLVSQTNTQAFDHFDEASRDPILFTDYADLSSAQIHFNALLNDKYRAILDLENEKHRKKIIEMTSPNSKYRTYVAFVNDIKKIEKEMNIKYTQNIRNYISKKTKWRIEAHETIHPKLELVFGELFIILKYRSQEERFRLADLEKY